MAWADFRAFLSELERRGEVKTVEGASCELEIGTLSELMCERQGPMLLFDGIPGYPQGYRIASKPYATPIRSAIALGLPEEASPFEMFKAWRSKIGAYNPLPAEKVAGGPVLENVQEGAAVDLLQFPTPRWHERDGGPYFGTGCSIITRDPDEDWVNVGTYRSMLHDKNTLGIDSAPYHHGTLHMQKWWAQGKSAPVALAISVDPALFWASTEALPWNISEYEYAGFIRGEPLEVIEGTCTGLPLPASAELIVEGEVPPPSEEQRKEGPFGEFTGYYAGGEKMRPILRVQAVYHRTHPVLHGDPPLKPPVGHWGCPPAGSIMRVWDGLDHTGIPGVKGVYALSTGGSLAIVVAIKQQYAGHARQVGRVASGLVHTFSRLIVVVDEDIDPSNAEEVLWAIATRTDPVTSFEIQPECPSSTLDPMIPPERKLQAKNLTSSRALIIACRPWEWMDQFPAVNRGSDALRKKTYDKWKALFA